MKITNISQCDNVLSFARQLPWPSGWPSFVWKNVVLVKASDNFSQVVELGGELNLESVLKDIYPQLTLIEVLQLAQACADAQLALDNTQFFKLYGFRWAEDLAQMGSVLLKTSPAFQAWCAEKEVGLRDVLPLKVLDKVNNSRGLLDQLIRLQPSKSDGVKWIEWVTDLSLMERLDRTVLANPKTADEMTALLMGLRYPQATALAQQTQNFIKKMPWPKNMQARPVRQGDRAGFEVKFFVQSQDELSKYAQGLADVAQSWSHHE